MRKTKTTTAPTRERRYFQIQVTDQDIARAKRNNSHHCVVTQAIARMIPDAARIEVDTQSIRFTRAQSGARHVYLTPYAVQGYVIAFDAGEPIEPFSFRLDHHRMLHVRRQLLTPAGKAAANAASRVRDAARRRGPHVEDGLPPATSVPASAGKSRPSSTARERGGKTAVAADARAAYAQARTAHPGQVVVSTEGERRAPRRVFKTGIRVYGQRLLRINRPKPPSVAAE